MPPAPWLADPERRAPHPADVLLLLEGTYPYVGGGVSSWVHEMIRGLPEHTFSLCFLGGERSAYGAMKYRLPDNVTHLQSHYLSDSWKSQTDPRPLRGRCPVLHDAARLHDALRAPTPSLPPDLVARVLATFGTPEGVTRAEFLHSDASWDRIAAEYRDRCTDPSFVDYFWTVRTMHAPLFQLAEIAHRLPPFRFAHAISTGYAGLLGAILRHLRRRPLLLSEHGIYTKERKIDLAHAEWIRDAPAATGAALDEPLGYVRRLWIRFFEGIGRLAYDAADPIVSLYQGNRARQIADGADAARTTVIPNGIELARFAPLRARRPAGVPRVVGLLGRVVPIKDIRTFVRALRTVVTRLPDAEGWIIGPEDESPAYGRECRELVRSLGLEGRVKFLGFRRPEEVLPELGLLVLTSISEALPLVVLEGFASGVPAVVTDVGACRELIEGASPDDRALGSAGAVVPIASPDATARAALALLTDEPRWRAAQAAGIARVEGHYTQAQMLDRYRALYQRAAASAPTGCPHARARAAAAGS